MIELVALLPLPFAVWMGVRCRWPILIAGVFLGPFVLLALAGALFGAVYAVDPGSFACAPNDCVFDGSAAAVMGTVVYALFGSFSLWAGLAIGAIGRAAGGRPGHPRPRRP